MRMSSLRLARLEELCTGMPQALELFLLARTQTRPSLPRRADVAISGDTASVDRGIRKEALLSVGPEDESWEALRGIHLGQRQQLYHWRLPLVPRPARHKNGMHDQRWMGLQCAYGLHAARHHPSHGTVDRTEACKRRRSCWPAARYGRRHADSVPRCSKPVLVCTGQVPRLDMDGQLPTA